MTSKLTLLAARRSEEYRELVMSADGRKVRFFAEFLQRVVFS
jgi:hypothetical protein